MNKTHQWKNIFCPGFSPLTKLKSRNNIDIYVKRDDLNHTEIQGNKLRKLKYNIKHVIDRNINEIVTFGGAWSNHIAAIAKASELFNIGCTGFIRGEELAYKPEIWSDTLLLAQSSGMKLEFINRVEYRKKENSDIFKNSIKNSFIIPEGGSNFHALKGVSEIIDELIAQNCIPDFIISACGTGGTVAGLIEGVCKHNLNTTVIGIPVLKGAEFLYEDIKNLSPHHDKVNWKLYTHYHAGGYARLNNEEMIQFGKKFTNTHKIELDKIYNIKSFYAAFDLINQHIIPPHSRVVILHTGGLQGGKIS